MRYGSVCSGIEAATVAWADLGWKPAFFAEIDPFCCALLKQKYPDVPNYGDFTKIGAEAGPIDLLCGGTPCQDFSVAGKRAGMDGARGNLTLEFLRLAERLSPRWVFWENVPGVLSIDGGRAFGAFIGGLGKLGYGVAYRVLDAQFFGVPQRRRRVFVVGYLGNWRAAAAVLFESHCLSGYPPPSRETGKGVAGCLGGGSGQRGWSPDTDRMTFVPDVSYALNAHPSLRYDAQSNETFIGVAPTLCGSGNRTGGDRPPGTTVDTCESLVPIGFYANDSGNDAGMDVCPTLRSMEGGGGNHPAVALPILEAGARTGHSTDDVRAGIGIGEDGDPMFTLQRGKQHAVGVSLRGRDGGGTAEMAEIASLRSSKGGSSRTYVGMPNESWPLQGFIDIITVYANATQTRPDQVLPLLREAVNSESVLYGIARGMHGIQAPEILRQRMHGQGISGKVQDRRDPSTGPIPGEDDKKENVLRAVRGSEESGRSSPGRESSEQRTIQPDGSLPVLPHEDAQDEACMHDLWKSPEGPRLLQQAFDSLTKIRRSKLQQDTVSEGVQRVRDASECPWTLWEALYAIQAIRKSLSERSQGSAMAVRRLTPL